MLVVFALGLALAGAAALQPLPSLAGKRVLFIGAHPDDIEAGAGGLIQTLTDVHYIIVTNGDKGCGAAFCANFTVSELATTRQAEQLAAAKVLNVKAQNVVFLGYEDAMVVSTPEVEIKMDVIAAIRRIQPDVVMSWFPYPSFNLMPSAGWDDLGFHPDHQAVGRIALDSTKFGAGLARLFPELGAAWRSMTQYYFWSYTTSATHYLDVTNLLPLKIASFLAHKSQYPNASVVGPAVTMTANMVGKDLGLNVAAEGFQAYF
jgi:LmbE family N-acetylglucosaminyl deacetylase